MEQNLLERIDKDIEELPINTQLELVEMIIRRVRVDSLPKKPKRDYTQYYGIINVKNIDDEILSLRDEWERKI